MLTLALVIVTVSMIHIMTNIPVIVLFLIPFLYPDSTREFGQHKGLSNSEGIPFRVLDELRINYHRICFYLRGIHTVDLERNRGKIDSSTTLQSLLVFTKQLNFSYVCSMDVLRRMPTDLGNDR